MTSTICRETAKISGVRTANYAWIIDKDLLAEDGDLESEVGVTGPSNASEPHLERLRTTNDGFRFRMLDDDGELYYEGRILVIKEEGEGMFGPLDDFGMPNAGCTEIQYVEPGKGWVGL